MSGWVYGQRRRLGGNTLLELVVVLAILGIIGGLTGLAFRATPNRRAIDSSAARIGDARRRAIQSGRTVTVTVQRDERILVVTAHADGTVLADSSLGVDRLSGRAGR